MWPLKSQQYEAVAREEELQDLDDGAKPARATYRRPQLRISLAGGGVIVLIVLVLGAFALGIIPSGSYTLPGSALASDSDEATGTQAETNPPQPTSACPQRREWRTLSPPERQAYISAVLCLRTRPSTLHPTTNYTAYDDFPWLHSHVGYYTHNSAPFLPWHRYFLHIYETTLRTQCGYQGSLVYWDWTLDSEALERSPVFDPATGFGGDGEVGGEVTVGRSGRCVVDGPFAGVRADYYDVKYAPHCLSRGFRDLEGKLGHMNGRDISPESIEEVLSLGDYESFVALMESRVHDAIPFGIGGDFETFTAPYDPIFFLHHTQLDRLWWLWQQKQPQQGLEAYSGHKQRHSMEMASLEDGIEMRGLALNVKVADVMDVERDLLCYRY